jgi:hypothetical protein
MLCRTHWQNWRGILLSPGSSSCTWKVYNCSSYDACQTSLQEGPESDCMQHDDSWSMDLYVQIYHFLFIFNNTWAMANVCWWHECTSFPQPAKDYCKHISWNTFDLDTDNGIPCCPSNSITKVIYIFAYSTLVTYASSFCYCPINAVKNNMNHKRIPYMLYCVILSCVWLTINGVWIGGSIHWPFIHSWLVPTLYRSPTHRLVSPVYYSLHYPFPGNGF